MSAIQDFQHGKRIIGTKFRTPDWSYDSSPALIGHSVPSPPKLDEVHPPSPTELPQQQNDYEIQDALPIVATSVQTSNSSLEFSPAPFAHSESLLRTPEEVQPCLPLDVQLQNELRVSSDMDSLPSKIASCAQCQGQRFNFAAYFHSAIFPCPPHTLLAQIEKSYMLKNRLLSLLVDYVVHAEELDNAKKKIIEDSISRWRHEVEGVVCHVRDSNTEGMEPLLGEVRRWADNMARSIWQHACGVTRFEGFDRPGSRLKSMRLLTRGFRERWEPVWVLLSQNQTVKESKHAESDLQILAY